jgi:NAD+ synthase (glutamine-hydrolysing)
LVVIMLIPIKIALSQLNPLVGDLAGNANLMRDAAAQARLEGASVIVFPELSLMGYPPEDLLLFPEFVAQAESLVQQLARETDDRLLWVIGAVGRNAQGQLTNEAIALGNGQILARYAKQSLPNYGVFDEKRYFAAGEEACVVVWQGVKLGLLVCEDIWQAEPALLAKQAGAQVLLSLHASPYEVGKVHQRMAVAQARFAQTGLPMVYVNQVGGQDALVFDGRSFVYDGKHFAYMPIAKSHLSYVVLTATGFEMQGSDWSETLPTTDLDWSVIWQMLVLGLGDYVRKNGFKGVLLGLSGGMDSALVVALAVDALGADAVEAVMMPFAYTSDISKIDAASQAEILGVRYTQLPIEPIYNSIEVTLSERFAGLASDVTEENLQARIRGLLLMAMSNKTGKLLLSTSNKSESAMGYATLYGDMNGGFAPLKDVPKTWVYALANWRNQQSMVIPQRVIDRPPSAELRPDQTDQDSLPPYDTLDAWIEGRMMQGASVDVLARASDVSCNDRMLNKSIRLLRLSEYKRRQAAPGIKITARSFDKDWRMPITNGWKG